MTVTFEPLNDPQVKSKSRKQFKMVVRLLRIPLFVGCILIISVVVTLASEFKYHMFQTNITISANRSSALINMGHHRFRISFPEDVGNPQECGDAEICVGWGGGEGPVLLVRKHKTSKNSMWKVAVKNTAGAKVSIELNGDYLYGGPVRQWPANNNQMNESAYVTGMSKTGAVAERYWFTSGGLAANVDFDGHLFVSQSSERLDLDFKNSLPYPSTNNTIKLILCLGENAKDAFACFPQTRKKTEPKMIRDPIWSTWVKFKANVSQEKVMKYANDIRDNGFGISTMEIDDKWETCYGNHQWDKSKFPDPKGMISELKSRGMYVTLWVHPFINVECEFFKEAEPYLYKLPNGTVGTTTWWNGEAGLIDFTNKKAVEWFKRRLQALKEEVGLTGFKFDAGEASYIPGISSGVTVVPVPNEHTREYVKMAATFGTMGEVRVGSQNTDAPIFQRLQDTDSHWEASKGGLRSVIPAVLTLNALGYTSVLPDMVGGNLYTAQCSKELYIRWLQLNTFLPVIQFSIAPWDYDQETVDISRILTWIHAEYAEIISREIEKGKLENGHRIISPVWWHSPNDETALTIDTEFLVGTNILVAPVVEEGVLSRDIYLPNGTWLDPLKSARFVGPTTVKNYPAPLETIPFFIKISD